MSLSPGDRLGPYEIVDGIGAGGMGKVYRATDSRLRREVAIKVGAAEFSQRSAREARLVAALNHTNICQIYDVGPNYLVMELVEGPTLADRLRQGPMPLEEALAIARQIGDALQAAHEKGIVHRDLKPANIKIGPGGVVKVLDFGLAKATDETSVDGDPEHSPTITLEQVTRTGTVMGTAAYMSPEQARGRQVDERADIWAYGVVLYEMLTGQRPFRGETISDTLAAVLTKEPDWSRLPPATDRLVRRCLAKDAQERLRAIGDAAYLLEESPHRGAPPRSTLQWKIAAAALAVVAVAFAWLWTSHRTTTPAAPLLRFSVDMGEDAALRPIRNVSMALSPDGSHFVFTTGKPLVKSQLAIRRLDQLKATALPGTDGAEGPFFSPDGKSIGFFADGKLRRIDTDGGSAVTLCDAPGARGGYWGADGNIVFAPTNRGGGLFRVPATGGTPQTVSTLDPQTGEISHRHPQVLPGGRAVLINKVSDADSYGSIDVQSFDSGKRKVLIEKGSYGRYLPSGHLVYSYGGMLFAAPMDTVRLELTGPPVPILEDVFYQNTTGIAGFTFSESGVFAYVAADPHEQMRPVAIINRNGTMEPLPVPGGRYTHPSVSPDGSRLAIAKREGPAIHIWIYTFDIQRFSRIPFQGGNSDYPVWTRDGKYLLFSSDAPAPGPGIYWMRADGAGAAQRVVEGTSLVSAYLSADALVYEVRAGPTTGVWKAPITGTGDPPRLGTPERLTNESILEPVLSPDARWIAYEGAVAGLPEIFVRPVSGFGGPWQVSNGGALAAWSKNGRELFYQNKPGHQIASITYSVSGNSFSSGHPQTWSETRVEDFDLMPDGKRAVAIPAADQKEATHVVFLLNFIDDLRRRTASSK